MTELNKAIHAGYALFNYRTKNSNGYVTTANLISVFERYRDKYQNYSEYQKFDMWSDILQKWVVSYLRKRVKPRGQMSQRKVHSLKFVDDGYRLSYEYLVRMVKFIVNLILKSKLAFTRGDVAYSYLQGLYEEYQRFNDSIHVNVKFVESKIKVKVAKPIARPQSWIESRWYVNPVGHKYQYRIDRPYNPKYHQYHSGFRILED